MSSAKAVHDATEESSARRGAAISAVTKILGLAAQSEPSAVPKANVTAAAQAKGELGASTRDARRAHGKMRAAEQGLAEGNESAPWLAQIETRTEGVKFAGEALRDMAEVGAEIPTSPSQLL